LAFLKKHVEILLGECDVFNSVRIIHSWENSTIQLLLTLNMAPSVLIIGAGGNFGSVLVKEFIRQRASFGRVAILTDASRVARFEAVKEHDIEVIAGSWTDPAVYKGNIPSNSFNKHI
jgi:hypothetical protein